MEAVATLLGFRGSTKGGQIPGNGDVATGPGLTLHMGLSCLQQTPHPVLEPESSGPGAPGHRTPSSHHIPGSPQLRAASGTCWSYYKMGRWRPCSSGREIQESSSPTPFQSGASRGHSVAVRVVEHNQPGFLPGMHRRRPL